MEVQAACREMFSDGDAQFVPQALSWASECFTGRYGDYQAVDARYHDFEHTLQGTLCMARLLRGRGHGSAQRRGPRREAVARDPKDRPSHAKQRRAGEHTHGER